MRLASRAIATRRSRRAAARTATPLSAAPDRGRRQIAAFTSCIRRGSSPGGHRAARRLLPPLQSRYAAWVADPSARADRNHPPPPALPTRQPGDLESAFPAAALPIVMCLPGPPSWRVERRRHTHLRDKTTAGQPPVEDDNWALLVI